MTAVELVPAHPSATRASLDLVSPAYELAEKIARTEFVPSALRGKPEAVLAAILTGHELGIGPMQSLAKINVIEGKPSMAAELMRALVLAAGHDLWVIDSNSTRCIVGAKRLGSERESTFTWTMDDAKKANLDGKQNWRRYPRAMLLARATSEAIRAVFPDVVAGVSYSTEELSDGEFVDFDDAPAAGAADAPKPRRARARKAATATPGERALETAPNPAAPAARAAELPPLPGEEDGIAGGVPAPSPGDGESEGPAGVASPGSSSPPPSTGEGHGADALPPDDGPALPLASRVAMWIGELEPPDGMSADDFRHAFLAVFSEGEYSSAKAVPGDGDTIARLRAAIARYRQGRIRLVAKNGTWRFVDGTGLPTDDPAGEHQRGPRPPVREYSKMKVAELAEECRNRGIEPAGTKAELIALLEAAA